VRPSFKGTRIIFAFAALVAFWTAAWTSNALPLPKPTIPDLSPTTTNAENDILRPPFTVLETRLIETNLSTKLSDCNFLSSKRAILRSIIKFSYRLRA
jgi:hypothetical protein